jgi:ADP-heptose:LPS heptosyltransferase
VFSHLQIYDPRERWLVGTADALLGVPAGLARLVPRRAPVWPPRRILLLRLERIGDLLMSAPSIAAVRAQAPDATIDLVVGSWNAPLAALIPGIDRVETLDAPWLTRSAPAGASAGAPATDDHTGLVRRAWSWRPRHYDLAINFEGDIRSHALMALSGARRRAGFDMAGGGPLLTTRVPFRPDEHTTTNAQRLVQAVFAAPGGSAGRSDGLSPETTSSALARKRATDVPDGTSAAASAARGDTGARGPAIPEARATLDAQAAPVDMPFRLAVPAEARARAAMLFAQAGEREGTRDREGRRERSVIAVHASGGRAIKQWPAGRFAKAAARLARAHDAALLLTGTTADRAVVDDMRAALPAGIEVRDLVGEVDLPLLAAMLERCRLLVTGDTGPMHLAAFVGTPIVAIFGPSDPARYAPLAAPHRVVRIDLPCAPCNRIRLPPARCQGHTPDCLDGVTVDAVCDAARDLLAEVASASAASPAPARSGS